MAPVWIEWTTQEDVRSEHVELPIVPAVGDIVVHNELPRAMRVTERFIHSEFVCCKCVFLVQPEDDEEL